MRAKVWHGTNQDFDRFDSEMLGLSTANSASRLAFFFAAGPEAAWDYAQSAARKLIPGQAGHEARVAALLAQADAAMKKRDMERYENLLMEAEDLETRALQAPPAGATLMFCELQLETPLTVSGQDRQVVINLGGVLEDAKNSGHDGVIIRDMQDTPSGNVIMDDHFAVFDPGRITFLGRAMSLEEAREIHDTELSPADPEI